MANLKLHRNWIFGIGWRAVTVAPALAIVLALTIAGSQSVHAQMYTKIHDFTGGQDGANPYAGLTMDRGGNLYGTTFGGGAGYGTVYKLIHKDSGWVFNPLYSFEGSGSNDGAGPFLGTVTIGPDGTLYGATLLGAGGGCSRFYSGCGTVFNLKPPPRACTTTLCPWTETVLYRFSGGSDGAYPVGDLVFDKAGNIYGAANGYAESPPGLVYELTQSGGTWTKTDLYAFAGGADGEFPESGLIFDLAGNLYGTTFSGGTNNVGTIYQLTHSGSGWTENTLHEFGGDGNPTATLISDSSGNLYGAASNGGTGGGGTVFEMTPSGGNWGYNVLNNFTGGYEAGPAAKLIMDANGNLYGTTYSDGKYKYGSVFELTPNGDGTWTEIDLYDFCAGGSPCSDGANPWSNLVFDAGGIYGTASVGGTNGDGVIFKITPN